MPYHKKRKKIWQLDRTFHCSVIGTCLTLTELQQLTLKCKLNLRDKLTDYDIHHLFVHIASDASYHAKKLHKFLDQKYQINIRRLVTQHSASELKKYWNQSKKSGDVAGDFWALSTHPSTSKELLDLIYADIHMLSHISGASLRLDTETFNKLKHKYQLLKQTYQNLNKTSQQRLNESQLKINRLTQKLLKNNDLQLRHDKIKNKLDAQNKTLSFEQVRNLTKKLDIERQRRIKAECALLQLKKEYGHTQHQLNKIRKFNNENSSEKTLKKTNEISFHLQNSQQQFSTDQLNLCGQCILYVGGRNNLYNHFRTLVEEHNGQFIHHDGGREEGPAKLDSTLCRADVVLCPLNCVSHKAMNTIKKHCANKTKPLAYMPRASISAFTKALIEVSN